MSRADHASPGIDRGALAVPALIVVAAAGVAGAASGMDALGRAMLGTAALGGFTLTHVFGLTGIGFLVERRAGFIRTFCVMAALFGLSLVALTLPRLDLFAGLDWNWQGKTLDLIWMLALIVMLSPAVRREMGWRLDVAPGTLGPALTNIVLWGVFGFAFARLGMLGPLSAEQLTIERVLFDVSHPNLVEEILFRGLLLLVLDRALGTRWTVLGARVGWGVVITAWLFGAVHGVHWAPEGGLGFDAALAGQTFVMGLALGWIRALTGSLWPAFLGHCAPEIGILVALYLM